MIWCPVLSCQFFSRWFNAFVPYALCQNRSVEIPLLEKFFANNFFLNEAYSLWNSLPLSITSSANHSIFMNRLNTHCHIPKNSTHNLLGINSHLTSIRCLLRQKPVKYHQKHLWCMRRYRDRLIPIPLL